MSTNPKHIGKYALQKFLGYGEKGEVWKALDTQQYRHVAIKLIRAELQSDSNFITRLQHGAQMIASLHHPNIIKILGFQTSQSAETDSTAYIVMNYVEGPNLDQYISCTARIGKFPSAADIVHLFVPISMALDYTHRKGIAHRNIKPTNILLDQRPHNANPYPGSSNPIGEPILTDFVIARSAGSTTNSLTSWQPGRYHYCSPEQAKGLPGSKQSDLYSLGIILYEICTGVLPFNGDNPITVLMQHLNATPPSPALTNPNIPPALTMVILQSIAKDPKDRFPSATSMAMALCQALDMPIPEDLYQAVQSSESIDVTTESSPRQPPPATRAILGRTSQPLQFPSSEDKQPTSSFIDSPSTPPIVTSSNNTSTLSSSSFPMQEQPRPEPPNLTSTEVSPPPLGHQVCPPGCYDHSGDTQSEEKGKLLKMDGIYGRFLLGKPDRTQILTLSACSGERHSLSNIPTMYPPYEQLWYNSSKPL